MHDSFPNYPYLNKMQPLKQFKILDLILKIPKIPTLKIPDLVHATTEHKYKFQEQTI